MRTFRKEVGLLAYASPSAVLATLGGIGSILGIILWTACYLTADVTVFPLFFLMLRYTTVYVICVSLFVLAAAATVFHLMPSAAKIKYMVRRALYHPRFGNPLRLHEGELLPRVSCQRTGNGVYSLTISSGAVTVEMIADAASAISSALNGRFSTYAITQTDIGIAYERVTFKVEDVTIDRSLTFTDVAQMRPASPTRLQVQAGTEIDLTTSGSMLVAGKTRSGKTTGIIALLLQALQCGRDEYGSEVIIIDPKQAELSRLPHVVTLDEDGGARGILRTLGRFAASSVSRQAVLNGLADRSGNAVKWWDAGMHPSFLFIDEYVALRSLLPSKAAKDDPDYCLATFDGLLRRIVTMGASAGCFVIISIAEASVESGGLPAMLRSAMSTKVLFRPTLPEGRLMWDSDKLADFSAGRVYGPGDAWFSSTDGLHDNVSYVHFPRMDFPFYRALGQLLAEYYSDSPATTTPPPPCET